MYPLDPFFSVLVAIAVLIGFIAWAWICWNLVNKAGYEQTSRWVMVGLMVLTPFGVLLFVLLPWPLQRRFDKLTQRIDEIELSVRFSPANQNVEAELNKLKGEFGLTKMKRPEKRPPW
ncbi:MAG: hypothetical protein NW224_16080 [Leptolyngbyaceae cyanobacterium bins.302]|nr:hypothetical protein [Leptolyngbyaceae cyanobacterium bins.302]